MRVFHIFTQTNSHINHKDIYLFLGIWASIFAVIALFPLIKAYDLSAIRIWAIVACGVSFALMLTPRVVIPVYRIWIIFGEILGFIISRTILGILFFGIFTPISLFFKLIGRDILHQIPDKNAKSYFSKRTSKPQSMKNQF